MKWGNRQEEKKYLKEKNLWIYNGKATNWNELTGFLYILPLGDIRFFNWQAVVTTLHVAGTVEVHERRYVTYVAEKTRVTVAKLLRMRIFKTVKGPIC